MTSTMTLLERVEGATDVDDLAGHLYLSHGKRERGGEYIAPFDRLTRSHQDLWRAIASDALSFLTALEAGDG